jgi:hypothetical protein
MIFAITTLLNSKVFASENKEESIEYYHKEDPNTTLSFRPTPPKIVSPTPVTDVSGPEVTLEWQKVAVADSYHVQVSDNPGFFNPLVNEQLYTELKYTVKGLEKGRLYFWRVASFKRDNVAGESKSNFTLGSFKVK